MNKDDKGEMIKDICNGEKCKLDTAVLLPTFLMFGQMINTGLIFLNGYTNGYKLQYKYAVFGIILYFSFVIGGIILAVMTA